MRVTFHRAARAEARRGKYWFADRDPASPETFQDSLDAAVAQLERFPESGEPHVEGTRRLVLQTVPYVLIYRVLPDRVRVIAVAHTRQRPGYWNDR